MKQINIEKVIKYFHWLVRSLFGLLFVAGIIFFVISCNRNHNEQRVFREDIARNEMEINTLTSNVLEYSLMDGSFIKGTPHMPCKMFIVYKLENMDEVADPDAEIEYSPIYWELPEELRAKTEDELNTLIQIYTYKSVTGEYENGWHAYTEYMDVTVIDMSSGNVIERTTLKDAPPSEVVYESSGTGRVSSWQVIYFLEELAGYTED